MDAGADGIDAAGEAEEVELFVLLADGVLGVDFGDVGVALLDGLAVEWSQRSVFRLIGLEREKKRERHLFELVLFGDFVFAGFGCLSVELFRGELGRAELLDGAGRPRGR